MEGEPVGASNRGRFLAYEGGDIDGQRRLIVPNDAALAGPIPEDDVDEAGAFEQLEGVHDHCAGKIEDTGELARRLWRREGRQENISRSVVQVGANHGVEVHVCVGRGEILSNWESELIFRKRTALAVPAPRPLALDPYIIRVLPW